MLSRNDGVVIMAPPSDNAEARKNIATLLSAIKPKQKVRGEVLGGLVGATAASRHHNGSELMPAQPASTISRWCAKYHTDAAVAARPAGGGCRELRRA